MASMQIKVGNVKIGGGVPITVQSMTTTLTSDIKSTVTQIKSLEAAGCDIVRIAVPDIDAANAIGEIKKHIMIPLVADIHFDHKLALRAAEAGADKLRINPGNIGGADNVRSVAQVCREKNIPIRVGVNGGSINKEIIAKHNGVTPEAMLESALGHVELLNRCDFNDICISVKASSVPLTIASYRLLSERVDYPLHLGVTEAGTEYMGLIKSSIGIGALLNDGIGDTIRVSLTAPPENEVRAGIGLLRALGLRRGYELISCPTCGRCRIDLISLAEDVENRLAQLDRDITVAVMGCPVNGPGEASRADYGIAGGDSAGVIFRKGKIIERASNAELADRLFQVINSEEENT